MRATLAQLPEDVRQSRVADSQETRGVFRRDQDGPGAGGGGAYTFVARLSRSTVDHAFPLRRGCGGGRGGGGLASIPYIYINVSA